MNKSGIQNIISKDGYDEPMNFDSDKEMDFDCIFEKDYDNNAFNSEFFNQHARPLSCFKRKIYITSALIVNEQCFISHM